MKIVLVCVLTASLVTLGCVCGCANTKPPATQGRDVDQARKLTERALLEMEANASEAEKTLQQAIRMDPYNGIAHNNLGTLYLNQNRLPEAAAAFETARTLLPLHPDPRLNLGLVFERAGRTQDAIDAYSAALELVPDDLDAIAALASLQVRRGMTDDRTPELLSTLQLRGATPQWREWASMQLIRLQAK